MYYTYELLDQAFAKNWQKTDQKIGENSPKNGKQLAKTGRKIEKADQTVTKLATVASLLY